MQMASNFVASRVFPNIPVAKQTDRYFVIPRGDFFRDEFEVRRPGAESAGANFRVSMAGYECEVRALHFDLADQARANQDSPLSLDMQATEFVTQKGMINKEVNWASNYFATGVWSIEADGATARSSSFDPTGSTANDLVYWDSDTSTPIEDVRLMMQYVQELTGFKPNVGVFSQRVYNVLVDHADIIGRLDRGQTTGPARAMKDSLAALFELDEVMVMAGVENSADEGVTDDFEFIGGKNALLAYRPPSPGIMVPAAGYTFNWTGYAASVAWMALKYRASVWNT